MSNNVRAVISNAEGLILLVTESDDKENWKLPGGSLESGEDPITGIKRELQEELGIDRKFMSPELKFKHLKTDDDLFDRYIFRINLGPIVIKPTGEIFRAEWFSLDKIPEGKNKQHILDAVKSSQA